MQEEGNNPQHIAIYPAMNVVSASEKFGLEELKFSIATAVGLIDSPNSYTDLYEEEEWSGDMELEQAGTPR